ncbi:hypothetical protein HWV62_45172 [Athelia sp. TMB]|nr:hypothetical protein HWV62_45172 [Athelia sp. TMB]
MAPTATPLKPATRTVPFTPKRPASSLSSVSGSVSSVSSLASGSSYTTAASANSTTATVGNPIKKFKAALSSESRVRSTATPMRPRPISTSLAPPPSSPTRATSPRPKTPGTPNGRSRSPMPESMMDVSRVDPEEVLVDAGTVEPGDGDVSIDGVDEAWLRANQKDGDKVLVSIRIRPTDSQCAWTSPTPTQIVLSADASASTTKAAHSAPTPNQTYNFDNILTGTPNKPIYAAVARAHVRAAMEGYNALVFAYGQTASGKTFTLSGDPDEPGVVPRAMKDIFRIIKETPDREYLLRCSYLEIYNETIHDLLGAGAGGPQVQILGNGVLAPLREEVVTSLAGVRAVLGRGEGNRRTASTDWNERSSRSHSVFRVVIESRERGGGDAVIPERATTPNYNGRSTPSMNGRSTPGLGNRDTSGPRLQSRGGRSVQVSTLSLIDLAGSERATSDKERTREGKYINTSLLTLGSVIGTLGENAAKGKSDHVPYRNSKLTRLLQPSLAGNARISVICTLNPSPSAIAESTSTLLFAQRIKRVHLKAEKREVVDTDALLERYRTEIEDLKRRLSEREVAAEEGGGMAGGKRRRLSAREQVDEGRAMRDLNGRIQQLTKLILTSATVEDGIDSRPASPGKPATEAGSGKVEWGMEVYEVQQELLAARRELEVRANQILSLEAALEARAPSSTEAEDGEPDDKDRVIAEQARTIQALQAAPASAELEQKLAASEEWARELARELEREKRARAKLEEERRALVGFVTRFDSVGLGGPGAALPPPSRLPAPTSTFAPRVSTLVEENENEESADEEGEVEGMLSPVKMELDASVMQAGSLLEEEWSVVEDGFEGDVSFEYPAKLRTGEKGRGKENVPT